MKNTTKFLGFIVIVAIAGFSMIACDNGTTPSGKSDPALSGTVSISGTADVGQTLTANTNSLGGNGTITYQWKRGTTNIGANSSTYTIQTADIGSAITVTVTRSGYTGNVSASTAVVTDPGLPALSGTVSITGLALVGETLTANTNSLGGSGAITYQWKRGIADIGTNSSTYTVQTADVGSTITVTVTRSGNSGSKASEPTDVVALSGLTGNDAADFGVSASIDDTFNVGSFAEWNEAHNAITGGGNNKNYIINIIADFYITTGRYSNNFGDVSGVKVSVRGEGKTLTLTSSGSIVRVGNEQTVILRDVTLRGYGSNSSYPVVYVSNGGTYTMQSGKITGNTASSVSGVYVAIAATFNMNGGEISGNTSSGNAGAVVSVYQYGTFTMNGGKISSNTSNSTTGGVVMISEGTFTMNGGEISGNTGRGVYYNSNETFIMQNGKISNNTSSGNGGGVYLNSGTLTMCDSEISGNTVSGTDSSGGGVYLNGNGTFTMNGGEISDNTVLGSGTRNGGGVYVGNGGTFTMNDGEISSNIGGGVNVASDGIFHIANGIIHGSNEADTSLRNTASVGAALSNSGTAQYGTFSGNTWNSNGTIHPTSYTIKIVDGVPYIGDELADNYTFNTATTDDWNNTLNAISTYNDFSYTINVTADFDLAGRTNSNFGIASGITVSIQGTDKTLNLSSNGNILRIGSNQTVILRDLTLQGRSSNDNSLVYVDGGTFTMNDVVISGNTVVYGSSSGGGVYVGGGTFTMNGGEISGNTASFSNSPSGGGGVYVASSGTFTMHGGEISGNSASSNYSSSGGGVYVYSGTFTMNGGEISGNTASSSSSSSSGGGVYVSGGTFTMHGGEISGNFSSSSGGGGVYVEDGTFTMTGGEISGNTAFSGGGVFVGEYGTFTMSGGEISGNTAEYGGGVFGYGTFRIVLGTIYGSNEDDTSLRNTASFGAALFGYAQHGTSSGETWNKSGDLNTTNNTIRVVNGMLY